MSVRIRKTSLLTAKEYTYIWVDLPDASFQETLDAKILGKDLYEILQIPFYAENINQHDIVECKDSNEVKHDFVKVIKSGGYQTIHVEFPEGSNHEVWLSYINVLERQGADWENSGRFFSISIPPTTAYKKIFQLIRKWEQLKVISIEAINVFNTMNSIEPFKQNLSFRGG